MKLTTDAVIPVAVTLISTVDVYLITVHTAVYI